MFDLSIFFLCQNILIIMLLFWFLSYLGLKFLKYKPYTNTQELYECGFLNIHKLNLSFNMAFFFIAVLLIIYDIEFFFLIPVLFNFHYLNIISLTALWVFVCLLIGSFYYDWQQNTFCWLQ